MRFVLGVGRRINEVIEQGAALGKEAKGIIGSVQQLREVAIELQVAPVRSSIHIHAATLWAHFQGGDVDAGLAELNGPAGTMIDDLLWWTEALKTARGRS
jgi:hypothetical protein